MNDAYGNSVQVDEPQKLHTILYEDRGLALLQRQDLIDSLSARDKYFITGHEMKKDAELKSSKPRVEISPIETVDIDEYMLSEKTDYFGDFDGWILEDVLYDNKGLIIAEEKPSGDNKMKFKSAGIDLFIRVLNRQPYEKVFYLHETIDQYCKLYCDIDIKIEYVKELEVDIIRITEEYILELFPDGEFFWSHAHSNDRSVKQDYFSLHMVYNLPGKCYPCPRSQKKFWEQFVEDTDIKVDLQVYRKNANMRMLYSSKRSDPNRPLIPVDGYSRKRVDHLITCREQEEFYPHDEIIDKVHREIDADINFIESISEIEYPGVECKRVPNKPNVYALGDNIICPHAGREHDSNHNFLIVRSYGILCGCHAGPCKAKGLILIYTFMDDLPDISNFMGLDVLCKEEMTKEIYMNIVKKHLTYIRGGTRPLWIYEKYSRIYDENVLVYLPNRVMFASYGCMIYSAKHKKYVLKTLQKQMDCDFMNVIGKKDITFEPYLYEPEDEQYSDYYNTFKGFRYKPTNDPINMKKIFPFTNHIDEVVCKYDEECYEHLLNMFAHYLQKPGKKTKVHVVMKSLPGAGKNIIYSILSKLLGMRYFLAVNDIDKITGRFDSVLSEKILTVCDELCGNSYAASNKLKNKITEELQTQEKKGIDTIQVKDYNNYVSLTNTLYSVRVDLGDRRYFCLELSNKYCGKDHRSYFDPLYDMLNNGTGLQDLFNYLIQRDISNWNPDNIPDTEFKRELQERSLSTSISFIIDYMGSEDYKDKKIFTCDLFESYKVWMHDNNPGLKAKCCKDFVSEIKMVGIDPKDTSNGRITIKSRTKQGYNLNWNKTRKILEKLLPSSEPILCDQEEYVELLNDFSVEELTAILERRKAQE